jgi:hypothetical protein
MLRGSVILLVFIALIYINQGCKNPEVDKEELIILECYNDTVSVIKLPDSFTDMNNRYQPYGSSNLYFVG